MSLERETDAGALGDLLIARATSRSAVAAAVLLLMGACGSSGDAKPTIDVQSGRSSSPSQKTPSDEEPLQTSFPDLGLELTEVPDVSGPQRDALKTYIDYIRGLEETGRSDEIKVASLLKKTAAPELLSSFDGSFTFLRENNKHFAGSRSVKISLAASRDSIIGFDRCDDLTKVMMVTDGKSAPASKDDTAASRAILTNAAGRWTVTESETREGESC